MNKEINPELLKNPEIEQIFNKIEKIPCVGGILISVFKENAENWEIIHDDWRANHKIYGKVTKIKFGEYTPVMMIDNYDEDHDAYLTIFDLTKYSYKEIEKKAGTKKLLDLELTLMTLSPYIHEFIYQLILCGEILVCPMMNI